MSSSTKVFNTLNVSQSSSQQSEEETFEFSSNLQTEAELKAHSQKIKGKSLASLDMSLVATKQDSAKPLDLSKLKNTILVFQPGPSTTAELPNISDAYKATCGLAGCGAEIVAFKDRYAEFQRLGFEVMGVSTKRSDQQQKFATEKGLPFALLSDQNAMLASALGLSMVKQTKNQENYFLIQPVVLVIDENGVIADCFVNVNERRIKPELNASRALNYLQQRQFSAEFNKVFQDMLKTVETNRANGIAMSDENFVEIVLTSTKQEAQRRGLIKEERRSRNEFTCS